jgi:2-polyprenyl-6-hydroxyphenyl methylase/3-demethylubiquinone-9 3-methyltransferase
MSNKGMLFHIRKLGKVYMDEGLLTKIHLIGRLIICPFLALKPYFPQDGDVLDVGCGYGLLFHLLDDSSCCRGRLFVGIDHDNKKIKIAERHKSPSMKFYNMALRDISSASFTIISIVDVLYAIDLDYWDGFLKDCFRILRPGGRIIIKEVIDRPRWKYWLSMAQERLVTDVLNITKGCRAHFESEKTYTDKLQKAGFKVGDMKAIGGPNHYSHYLFICDKESL